jgi:hypothetical protein
MSAIEVFAVRLTAIGFEEMLGTSYEKKGRPWINGY